MMFVGNPLSAMGSAPDLLPDGWSTLGQLLPPGATGTALRSTAFFDGHAAAAPLMVLACWVIGGLIMFGTAALRAPATATPIVAT